MMFAEINPAYLVAALFFFTSGCLLYLSVNLYTDTAKSKLRWNYMIVGFHLTFFSLFYGLMTIAENETLLRLSWAGGFIASCLFYPRWVLFLSNIVTFQFRVSYQFFKATYVLTLLVSLLCVLSNDVVFVPTKYGNQFSYQSSPLFITTFILISLFIIIFMVLHVRWWREAIMKRHRKQAFWFIIIAGSVAPIGFATDFIIPIFTEMTVVPLGSVTLLAASIPIFISLRTTQTLSVTVPNVSGYLFNSVTIPTLILNHKNTIVLENKFAFDFLGRDAVGKNLAEIVFKDDTSPEQSFFANSFASENVRVKTPLGIRICDMLLTVEKDKYDDALCKIALLRDITKNEYDHNLLRAVNHAIVLLIQAEMDEFETALQESMGIVGNAVDADRVYIWKNHEKDGRLFCTQLYEWSENVEPQQGNEYTVGISYDDNMPGWEDKFLRGQCVNGPICDLSPEEQSLLSPQGIISILVMPIFLRDEFWGFVGFDDCRNERLFTENEISILRSGSMLIANALLRNEMTQQLMHATEAAQAASHSKSAFLANMSHEIRTPMNAILGITEILMEHGTIRPEIEEGLIKIYNSCNLLLGIINDILDFSKIEAGKLDILPAQYSLASLINDASQLNVMRIDSKPIEFVLQVNENVPAKLIGDELRIKQILNNLLSNAFKYTNAGKVTLSVTSESSSDRSVGVELPSRERDVIGNAVTLVLRVQDTGVGMTKEQLKNLFVEYSRFHQESGISVEGTGLGLSITQRLVSLMGGKIHVESERGIGSTFVVRLPQKTVGSDILGGKVVEDLQQFRLSQTTYRQRSHIIRTMMPYGRVLVVDDVKINLYVATGLMKHYQLQIETVMNGREAIDKIKDGNVYDIIFMDHMMPEMDGMEATKHLRNLGYVNPIIALTANAVIGQEDMFLQNGFDDFISKPIDIHRLNSVLNRFVRDKQPPEDQMQ
ncbi:MAG: ATP-binding protein [Planctomycetaceae bacterium]|nr:ATP-binding protein [Planctomycetaceae bacterium]